MPGLTLVTPPAAEPVSLAEAKLFCRVDVTDDDALITDLIAAARKRCEAWRGIAFVNQTWDYFIDFFPRYNDGTDHLFSPVVPSFPWANGWVDRPIVLPRFPLSSVTTVTYTRSDGTPLVISSADYGVDVANVIAPRIMPQVGKMWPADLLMSLNGVAVRFVAGYGAAAANVPEQFRLAIKQLVAFWYQNRDATGQMPSGVEQLLTEALGGVAYA